MTNVRSFIGSPLFQSLGLLFLANSIPLLALASETAKEVAGEVVSTEGVVFIRPDVSAAGAAGQKSKQGIKPAKPGDQVRAGDVINTSSNGKIKVLMKDKSIIDLGPSALFKVEHYANKDGKNREVDVNMIYGTLRTAVTQKIEGKGRFHIRTPTATMGVRGTEFVVKSEIKNLSDLQNATKNMAMQNSKNPAAPHTQARTEITVLQGEVAVAKKEAGRLPISLGSAGAPLPAQAVSLTAGMQVSAKEGETKMPKPVVLDQKQLTSVTTSAKVVDNTFVKAVIIDVPASNSNGNAPNSGSRGAFRDPASGSATGESASAAAGMGTATLDAIKTTVSETPAPVLPPVVFTHPVDVFNPVPVNTQAGMKKLRVIVVTP